ncbi:LysM peptidoglycan-binding domain-containing protein [Bacteroides sp. 214]|uniref:PBP1 and LysM peptidoglycan-binding domain-containing protein n=1 Tax=Bacteroides sp. 214 TaxID=2302935 RepID=UPI0013D06151|nr:LysM peptidoglycan-binding domain-containing protein [Bacteroides sp. 214]NDW12712.1 LysM peptidoglycan-binding domain-containing protein [Bacteroides sp. 214]
MIVRKKILFIILASCFWVLTPLGAQESNTYFLHTIERGQNLYSISNMYGVSQADIVKLNPGAENAVYAGQTLKIPQVITTNKEEIFHTIKQGETLWRLTQTYGISVKELCEANPGLSAENFKIGQVIRIPAPKQEVVEQVTEIQAEVKPRCKEMHKVKRKETIYSISRKYRITEEALKAANPELKEGLKKGQLLCIPYPVSKTSTPKKTEDLFATAPSNFELFRKNKEYGEKLSVIKAAIILPITKEARMLEYYEGFLLAVDSLKRMGVSMDIHVYNSGDRTTSINPILAKEELKQMHIIFGPLYQEHIKPLATFAKEHDIRLVIPTISKDSEVFDNPNIYLINTPQSYLYSRVYDHFFRQFRDANVIILDMKESDKDKEEFIKGLKQELALKSISTQTIDASNMELPALKELLDKEKENIFIPTSGSDLALIKILPLLKLLKLEEPELNTTLFGYPEWQKYTTDYLETFFEQNTYFYSSFYANNLLPASTNFINTYNKMYGKEMINSPIKYGMLGFDTGYYFLYGLSKYGTDLENNLKSVRVKPIQTGFGFERVNNWGGFINKKVFFVHFTNQYDLIKLEFD